MRDFAPNRAALVGAASFWGSVPLIAAHMVKAKKLKKSVGIASSVVASFMTRVLLKASAKLGKFDRKERPFSNAFVSLAMIFIATHVV